MPANFTVKTTIKAVDRATRPIRRISGIISGRLVRSLRKVGKAAGRAAMWLGKMALKAAAVGAAMALAASVGIFRMINSTQKALDTMGKFVRRSGIAVEAYQELKHAADIAGVSSEEFDKSLEKFTRNLGDAKAGFGTLTEMLKRVAPAFLDQLKSTKSVGDAFELMVAAMGELKDPAARASLAAAAFGRAGQSMTLIMEKGSVEVARLRKEAHELGLVVGGRATAAAEDYVDAMARLKGAIRGVVLQASIGLGPWLTKLADRMRKYVVANRMLIKQKIEKVFRRLVVWIQKLWKWLSKVDWKKVAKDFEGFMSSLGGAAEAIGGVKNALMALGGLMAGSFLLDIAAAIKGIGLLGGSSTATATLLGGAKIAGMGWGAAFALAAGAAITAGLVIKRGLDESEARKREFEAGKARKKARALRDLVMLEGGGAVEKGRGSTAQEFRKDAASRFDNEGQGQLVLTQIKLQEEQNRNMRSTLALIGAGPGKRPTLIPKTMRVSPVAGGAAPTITGGTVTHKTKSEVVVRFVNAPPGTTAEVRDKEGAGKVTPKVGKRRVGE